MKKINFHFFKKFLFILFIWSLNTAIYAQCWQMVWADEFEGTNLDNSKWEYGIGTSNDNVHYYTSRNNNVTVSDGTLKIIALEESYQGLSYTSGLIKTTFKAAWKYGRIESRIKLPSSNGFVPAFWMLPEDNIYGWWPNSGEIDIMEHPTNQVSQIYGTVHTRAYNSFTGSGPRGDVITISDAETQFHVYAVEWNANQIDFFVDDQKYFTFYNDYSGNSTWPFDQQFHLILNLAVGGGWVGNPNSSTVFPAIMEVDYVRVSQNIFDINITGPDFLIEGAKNITYSLPSIDGAAYTWNVPSGAQIITGQGTNKILTDWGSSGGSISADIQFGSCSNSIDYAVNVSSNNVLNASFEKGGKYWEKAVGYPASADFEIVSNEVKNGNNSLKVDVKNLGNYPWDIQLS
jgi:beta-glucanase (GH16 family)